MDFLPVLLTFLAAYGVFLFLAYGLARLFFPTLEVQDSDMKPRREKTKSVRRAYIR